MIFESLLRLSASIEELLAALAVSPE